MAIFELFSKRQKILRGEISDIYVYDKIPNALRVQIVHVFSDALRVERGMARNEELSYERIVGVLCKEYGVFRLSGVGIYRDLKTELIEFFLAEPDFEKVLDVVEVVFLYIDSVTRKCEYGGYHDCDRRADDAISELNARFKEHGVGFQYLDGKIVRIDSELIHAEAVKPALRLLNEVIYQGAQQEFLSAYEHYRHGRNKESLNDCLKAFESTMKAICDKRKWQYKQNATAKALIDACFDNDLVPKFWQNNFTSLKSMLESSIPTGRNKLSGHGQGSVPTAVPDHLVAYMLHMTASTIVFLVNAEKSI